MAHSTTKEIRARQRRFRWAAVAGLAVLAILLNEVIGHTGYLARREQIRRIQTLGSEVDELKKENEQLTQRIKDLRSDPAAIEEMAREQLHLGRPGEVVITIPPPAANSAR
jgi:cell division protein FtsB